MLGKFLRKNASVYYGTSHAFSSETGANEEEDIKVNENTELGVIQNKPEYNSYFLENPRMW